MRKALCVAVLVAGSILPAAGLATEPLGRLFFTPEQRVALDAGKQIRTPRSSRALSVRDPREVTLNGVVTRSDGDSTVWVNGRALDKQPASGISATASGSDPAAARVKVRGARNTVQMRVGQQLDPVSGKVLESYELAVPSTAAVVHSPKKLVREDGAPAAGRPDKTSAADADEPSNK